MPDIDISSLRRSLHPFDEANEPLVALAVSAADSDGLANEEDNVLTDQEIRSHFGRVATQARDALQLLESNQTQFVGSLERARTFLRAQQGQDLIPVVEEHAAESQPDSLEQPEFDALLRYLREISTEPENSDIDVLTRRIEDLSQRYQELERRYPDNFLPLSIEERRRPIDLSQVPWDRTDAFGGNEMAEFVETLDSLGLEGPVSRFEDVQAAVARILPVRDEGDRIAEIAFNQLRLRLLRLSDVLEGDPQRRNLQLSRLVLEDLSHMREGFTEYDRHYASSNPLTDAIDGITWLVTAGYRTTGGEGYRSAILSSVDAHDSERGLALDALRRLIEQPPADMRSDRSIPNALDYLNAHRSEYQLRNGRTYYEILTGPTFQAPQLWSLRNRRVLNAVDRQNNLIEWLNFADQLREGTGSWWVPELHCDGALNLSFARAIIRGVLRQAEQPELRLDALQTFQDSVGTDITDAAGHVLQRGGGDLGWWIPNWFRNYSDESHVHAISNGILLGATALTVAPRAYAGVREAFATAAAEQSLLRTFAIGANRTAMGQISSLSLGRNLFAGGVGLVATVRAFRALNTSRIEESSFIFDRTHRPIDESDEFHISPQQTVENDSPATENQAHPPLDQAMSMDGGTGADGGMDASVIP